MGSCLYPEGSCLYPVWAPVYTSTQIKERWSWRARNRLLPTRPDLPEFVASDELTVDDDSSTLQDALFLDINESSLPSARLQINQLRPPLGVCTRFDLELAEWPADNRQVQKHIQVTSFTSYITTEKSTFKWLLLRLPKPIIFFSRLQLQTTSLTIPSMHITAVHTG